MVTSQNGLVDGCCFDYGNGETDSRDDGNGTMEAVYFGGGVVWGTGSPGGHDNGPWVMADLENGLYAGWENNQDQNITTNTPLRLAFITAAWSAILHGRRGRGTAASGPLRALRRRCDDGHAEDHVRRHSPGRRPATSPCEAGVDHSRDRRRQQRQRRRAVFRGRDGHRGRDDRDRQRAAGEHRRRADTGSRNDRSGFARTHGGGGRTRSAAGVARWISRRRTFQRCTFSRVRCATRKVARLY